MERTIGHINQRLQRYSALVRRRHHVSPPAAITSLSAYHVPPSPVWNGMSLVFMPKKPVTKRRRQHAGRQHRQRAQAAVGDRRDAAGALVPQP